MSLVVEKCYSPRELVFLLGFTERHWVERAKRGAAARAQGQRDVELVNSKFIWGEWRITAGDVNRLDQSATVVNLDELGVAARSEGELRRKAGLRRGKLNGAIQEVDSPERRPYRGGSEDV